MCGFLRVFFVWRFRSDWCLSFLQDFRNVFGTELLVVGVWKRRCFPPFCRPDTQYTTDLPPVVFVGL